MSFVKSAQSDLALDSGSGAGMTDDEEIPLPQGEGIRKTDQKGENVKKRSVLSWMLALSLGTTVLTGCVPLVAGVAVGAGGYAWVSGRLVKDFDAPAEKVNKAVHEAVSKLGLDIKKEKTDRLSGLTVAEFSDGADVRITVEAQTEYTAQMIIRVGWLGDKARSELVLEKVESEL